MLERDAPCDTSIMTTHDDAWFDLEPDTHPLAREGYVIPQCGVCEASGLPSLPDAAERWGHAHIEERRAAEKKSN
jgi:hypothetical protein